MRIDSSKKEYFASSRIFRPSFVVSTIKISTVCKLNYICFFEEQALRETEFYSHNFNFGTLHLRSPQCCPPGIFNAFFGKIGIF